MISLYTSGLTTLLGFWFVSHFREWKTTFPQSSHSPISTQRSGMHICHQIPSTSAAGGKKEPVVPWRSGREPCGSPLEEGNEMLWMSSFQLQQGLDNPNGCTWGRTSSHAMLQSNLHSKFLWQELPRHLPELHWCSLGSSASGWWICAVPNCTGKMRRLPTGCRTSFNSRECSEHR